MSSSGSPCGACKFLRRKCANGCVFAPYFCHEQGSSHFAAIHKVFGASNASKILSNLPISDRCEAAITISYEAQARLQDPIYGCVSHIFALQQQVVNLQAQLEILKQQAAQSIMFADSPSSENPNSYYGDNTTTPYHHQEHQNIHHHHHDQTHLVNQTGSSGMVQRGDAIANSYPTENSSGFGQFSIYPDLEQHLNPFNQDHLKVLQSVNLGYISFS
ncbi:LOB domain-containing protein 29 [Raphanus sativus]|uniref:LOB domain-containing protein 29-like n=1 Tax=Raphanus sativus TaxID=3726 RepID=A0A6J0LR23_RAPSA|nr:LOB domain-containing protein 29-like [Raphanus sativus]KAJ4904917.1 LOB domain-containing protein 29 [Raphanus sativus]